MSKHPWISLGSIRARFDDLEDLRQYLLDLNVAMLRYLDISSKTDSIGTVVERLNLILNLLLDISGEMDE